MNRHVAPSTQNQAISALLFLYRHVLEQALPWLDDIIRAKKPARLPVVLIVDEVGKLLGKLSAEKWLMASLLYGSGLRLLECMRLRMHDIEFDRRPVMVRNGKWGKDRITMLPDPVAEPLKRQIDRVRIIHEEDTGQCLGEVYLPYALEIKYPNAAIAFGWQYLFPANKAPRIPRRERCDAQAKEIPGFAETTPYYHCVSHCIRRAFLCGVSTLAGNSY